MKNIKLKILESAKALFNKKGVSNVSIREISREIGISHSNLMYHFPDKNALIDSLHQQILTAAIQLNQEIGDQENTLKSIFISTISGFDIIYDYRFFMLDFNLILKENYELHKQIKEIELLRFKMYEEKIIKMIKEKIIREEVYTNEYKDFITLLRVYSDYWVLSSQVYEQNPQLTIKKYVKLFLLNFYPYLTKGGRDNFDSLVAEFKL